MVRNGLDEKIFCPAPLTTNVALVDNYQICCESFIANQTRVAIFYVSFRNSDSNIVVFDVSRI